MKFVPRSLIFAHFLGSAAGLAGLTVPIPLRAEEKSATPYIDQLKQQLKNFDVPARTSEHPDPYIQSLKSRQALQPEDPAEPGSYSENLKKKLGPKPKGPSFTESEKARIGNTPSGGAIAALKEGHSELYAKKVGVPKNHVGLQFGASEARSVVATSDYAARPFTDVYGSGLAPDVTLYFEQKLIGNEPFGSLGIYSSLGVAYSSGTGKFKVPLTNAGGQDSSLAFPIVSSTQFQFFTLPINVGAVYRMSFWKYVRPFAQLGPTLTAFYEARNDNQGGKSGYSWGYVGSLGVDFLMDWISAKADWEAYSTSGIHHTFFTVQYKQLGTIASPVDFEVSGIHAGVTFEY